MIYHDKRKLKKKTPEDMFLLARSWFLGVRLFFE